MIRHSPRIPIGRDDAPVFEEPWQAQAFAFAVHLHERGLFTWGEWAETIGRELTAPEASATASDYYHCWMRALENLIAAKKVSTPAEIDEVTAAWHRAAAVTPHGAPILLENDPGA